MKSKRRNGHIWPLLHAKLTPMHWSTHIAESSGALVPVKYLADTRVSGRKGRWRAAEEKRALQCLRTAELTLGRGLAALVERIGTRAPLTYFVRATVSGTREIGRPVEKKKLPSAFAKQRVDARAWISTSVKTDRGPCDIRVSRGDGSKWKRRKMAARRREGCTGSQSCRLPS